MYGLATVWDASPPTRIRLQFIWVASWGTPNAVDSVDPSVSQNTRPDGLLETSLATRPTTGPASRSEEATAGSSLVHDKPRSLAIHPERLSQNLSAGAGVWSARREELGLRQKTGGDGGPTLVARRQNGAVRARRSWR